MELTTGVYYVMGLILLLALIYLFATPLEILVRVAASSVAGAAVIWVCNVGLSGLGLHIGLNPVSAVVAGLLGWPGVVGLGLISLILG